MKAETLLEGVKYTTNTDISDMEISDICSDSRDVRPGDLFVALTGTKSDGKRFVREALEKGARAILTDTPLKDNAAQIITGDVRGAYARVCENFFSNPARKLKLIGVTGTNGKSTVAYLIHKIACKCGIRCGLIGTMYIHDGCEKSPSVLTTPDPYELNKILAHFADCGCKAAAMEVSAHALYWHKTDGIVFDMGVFTNLTRDHLDFFKDMEEYGQTKFSFFTPEHIKKAVINSDSAEGVRLINSVKVPVVTYGLYNPADVFAVNIVQGDKCGYVVNDRDCLMEIRSKLHGEFNVSNSLAAIACVGELGADCANIARAMNSTPAPEGRFNVYKRDGKTYIIDFAHTPDGLENVLTQARKLCKGELILVFGCGGDRDKGKRAVMGKIASRLADEVIITEDNPRMEEQSDIAKDIMQGIEGRAVCIDDRKEAVALACSMAKEGDVVLIAGKGSEGYIDAGGVKTLYSDREELFKVLDR